MKKIFSLFLVLVLTIGLFGCTKSENEPTTEVQGTEATELQEKTLKIGIAAPHVTHGWVACVAYYAEKYCRENNIEYEILTSSDAEEMAASFDALITNGASVILAYPQWSGNEDAVAKVIAKGIPVINFDVDVATEGVYKVTGDNYNMGYESAKYIVSKAGSAASIAVMDVPSAGSVSELRKKGFYDYLDEVGYDKSNIFEVQCKAFSRDCGYSDMTTVLSEHKKVDAVFSLDDETSIGCIQAIQEADRKDIKAITGGGGMQEYFKMINDSQYNYLGLATALYSPSMIQDAIKLAKPLLNGESVEKETIIPTTLVTRTNVTQFIDEENTIY